MELEDQYVYRGHGNNRVCQFEKKIVERDHEETTVRATLRVGVQNQRDIFLILPMQKMPKNWSNWFKNLQTKFPPDLHWEDPRISTPSRKNIGTISRRQRNWNMMQKRACYLSTNKNSNNSSDKRSTNKSTTNKASSLFDIVDSTQCNRNWKLLQYGKTNTR